MRNIEIKARIKDFEALERTASGLAGQVPRSSLRQVDTYFHSPVGRLKLRERDGCSELIFYRRADAAHPKRSCYHLLKVRSPSAAKRFLKAALGVKSTVTKHRIVYLYRNVRIHLDRVEGLGAFIELEAVVTGGTSSKECELLVRDLMRAFYISDKDLVSGSYSDLLDKR